jgi:hypothetical protein
MSTSHRLSSLSDVILKKLAAIRQAECPGCLRPDVASKLATAGRTSSVLLRGWLREFDMQKFQQLLVLGFGGGQMLVHVGTAGGQLRLLWIVGDVFLGIRAALFRRFIEMPVFPQSLQSAYSLKMRESVCFLPWLSGAPENGVNASGLTGLLVAQDARSKCHRQGDSSVLQIKNALASRSGRRASAAAQPSYEGSIDSTVFARSLAVFPGRADDRSARPQAATTCNDRTGHPTFKSRFASGKAA